MSEYNTFKSEILSITLRKSRWYIEEVVQGKVGSIQRYGAIELSQSPFEHKTWKRLKPIKSEEVEMTMKPLALICTPSLSLVENLKHVISLYELLDQYGQMTLPESIAQARQNLQGCYYHIEQRLHRGHTSTDEILTSSWKSFRQFVQCETFVLGGSILQAKECYEQILETTRLSTADFEQMIINTKGYVDHDFADILSSDANLTASVISEFVRIASVHAVMFDLVIVQSGTQTMHWICSLSAQMNRKISSLGSIALFLLGRYDAWELQQYQQAEESQQDMVINYFTVCTGDFTITATRANAMVNVKDVQNMIQQLQWYSKIYSGDFIVSDMTAANSNNHGNREEFLNKVEYFFQRFPTSSSHQQQQQQQRDIHDDGNRNRISTLVTEDMLSSRQFFSYATSLVTTLLSAGLIETASYHFMNTILIESSQVAMLLHASQEIIDQFDQIAMCTTPIAWNRDHRYEPSSCLGQCQQTILSLIIDRMQCHEKNSLCQALFYHKRSNSSNDSRTWENVMKIRVESIIQQSSLIRSVYLLHQSVLNPYLLQIIVSDNDLFSMFLSIVTQAVNPVILEIQGKTWLDEVIVLRLLAMDILDKIGRICGSSNHDDNDSRCYLRIDGQSTGVRGLFLEAYQGLSLLSTYLQTSLHQHRLLSSTDDWTSTTSNEASLSRDPYVKNLMRWLKEVDQYFADSITSKKYFSIIRQIQQHHPAIQPPPQQQQTQQQIQKVMESDTADTDTDSSHVKAAEHRGMMPYLAHQFYRNQYRYKDQSKVSSNASKLRLLKVAVISYSLTRHSVGRLLSKVIVELASHPMRYQCEVYVISNVPHLGSNGTDITNSQRGTTPHSGGYDDITAYMQTHIQASHWIFLPSFQFGSVFQSTMMQTILSLGLDIAIYTDILMQPSLQVWTHSIRLAKIQMAFWGHPYTSGDEDWIDYFISSKTFEEEHGLINR
jgi:hypothetical protein